MLSPERNSNREPPVYKDTELPLAQNSSIHTLFNTFPMSRSSFDVTETVRNSLCIP
jgi:hypothetical protein